MTLVNYALTTLEKVKLSMGISDTSKDLIIEQTINGISAVIQRYCGRNFVSQSYTEVYDGKSKSKIFLNNYPVSVLNFVKYRSGTPSQTIWNVYSPDSYLLYERAGYIAFYGNITSVKQGYQVSYTAGYLVDWSNEFSATHTLPADLTQVVTDLVNQSVSTSNSQGLSSISTEGQSVVFDMAGKGISPQQKAIINSHKSYKV